MSEIQEAIDTRVCIKVLSCDPKGDHVNFKWEISKKEKKKLLRYTCIYLHLLYLTKDKHFTLWLCTYSSLR